MMSSLAAVRMMSRIYAGLTIVQQLQRRKKSCPSESNLLNPSLCALCCPDDHGNLYNIGRSTASSLMTVRMMMKMVT